MPLDYSSLVNQDRDEQETALLNATLAQTTPAARLAVYLNASLLPKWRIERHSIVQLDAAFACMDEHLLRAYAAKPHRLQSLIASAMLEDLEARKKEEYTPPMWAQ